MDFVLCKVECMWCDNKDPFNVAVPEPTHQVLLSGNNGSLAAPLSCKKQDFFITLTSYYYNISAF